MVSRILRDAFAVIIGLIVTAAILLLPPWNVAKDYAGIIVGASMVGMLARRRAWLYGGLIGMAFATCFVFGLYMIGAPYPWIFWGHATEIFVDAVSFVIVGATAAGVVSWLTKKKRQSVV